MIEYRFIYLLAVLFPIVSCNTIPLKTEKDPIDFVDMFIGTAGDYGQNDPAACVPHGMVKLCPDSDPPNHAGYDYEQPRISGISINRISGVGSRGKGGSLSIKPCTGSYEDEVRIIKGSERAIPGFYETKLDNGVHVRLTATNNIGLQEYTFPESPKASLVVNLHASFTEFKEASCHTLSDREIYGKVASKLGAIKHFVQYFYIKSNVAFEDIKKDSNLVHLVFAESPSHPVEIRVAISGIDWATAVKEHQAERRTFEEIKEDAFARWSEQLSKIEVEGDEEHKTIFYRCLYNTFLTPVDVTSLDGRYLAGNGEIKKTDGFKYYSSWSTWDTYRTKFPLMSILEPGIFKDVCRSQVELYKAGKPNYFWATPTVRNDHSILILADALSKEVKDFDLEACYPELEREAEGLPYGDPGSCMESAYDLHVLAEISKSLGKEDKHRKYMQLSDSIWKTEWEAKFRQIVPETFDTVHGSGLYEGTLWQYRWAVPYDIEGLIEIGGGKDTLANQLEYFFENNLHNHGNQPAIHAPFLFNYFGKPYLAQRWVNTILTKKMVHRYGTHDKFLQPFIGKTYRAEPRGFIPEMDDDDATMSAWYVFAAMGLYPLKVGEPVYELTAPIFEHVRLNLDNGKTFKITCKNFSSENVYIQSATLNGAPYGRARISHRDLLNGGELVFKLGDKPNNTWGIDEP
ncbi:MAG: glycoside hydrolase family 92 protein [Cytophagales bacterium]|nr:glycoside hydrolase family 92 protein [Cytophagales bacterium]